MVATRNVSASVDLYEVAWVAYGPDLEQWVVRADASGSGYTEIGLVKSYSRSTVADRPIREAVMTDVGPLLWDHFILEWVGIASRLDI